MNIKKYLIVLTIISAIFFSYNYLQPMGSEFYELNKSEYTLKTHGIRKDNKWSKFRDDKNGIFFIHPGEKKASRGVFTFKKNRKLLFELVSAKPTIII